MSVFFTRDEVVIHNQTDDMWVTVNCRVFDLTNLIRNRLETINDVSFDFCFVSQTFRRQLTSTEFKFVGAVCGKGPKLGI